MFLIYSRKGGGLRVMLLARSFSWTKNNQASERAVALRSHVLELSAAPSVASVAASGAPGARPWARREGAIARAPLGTCADLVWVMGWGDVGCEGEQRKRRDTKHVAVTPLGVVPREGVRSGRVGGQGK